VFAGDVALVRCPYFDECNQDFAGAFAKDVYRCTRCGRLSIKCEISRCGAVNRPFTLFCRRCRDSVLVHDCKGTGDELWEAAARLNVDALPTTSQAAETVCNLSLLAGVQSRKSLLTMQFIDGLLAIHQAGCCVALVHPFSQCDGNGDADRTIAYAKPEEDRFRYRAEQCRPYPPLRLGNHRHILFSHPAAVYAVDVWSLPGWASDVEPTRFHTLVDCGGDGSARLACSPVAWGDSKFGLISYTNDASGQARCYWAAFDVGEQSTQPPIENLLQRSVAIGVTGWPCRAETVGNSVVVIATPEGHWAWRLDDASAGRVDRMRRTWPTAAAAGKLVMNRHDEDDHEFHALRHCLFYHSNGDGREPRRYTHYYQRSQGAADVLECYGVDCESLEAERPTLLDSARGVMPLGPYRESDEGPRRMLFADNDYLWFEDGLRLERLPRQQLAGAVANAAGVAFRDPTLALVQGGNLHVRSLATRDETCPIALPEIAAEPLLWSRWVFTIERNPDDSLLLRRRELQRKE
jgi:hypothetical protein